MKTHEDMIEEWMKEPEFKAEYDALWEEFALFDELLKARKFAGLTQSEVARRMGTKTRAIVRLESGRGKHSPTIGILRKYAEAVGCRLEIKLVPR
ncbi:MAG: helix-turn-helix domain-containing protein [bacterium]